ncbi:alpha/beta hydrolase [Paenibacillus sp. GSMTC-2017]|uniref:alpha/beta fold hydrolase n=1 Tax=Paenibacillus sp. GSMTC-2017 TaxID=2794350 RepID=UPI0018D91D82|nr:alpha/beta hydrolase [Paenibacillus sp. GSMTC-2017]MBH5317544.1 alpha/beta hydrolase [Paenibacillus sp. GSMTC-2017]
MIKSFKSEKKRLQVLHSYDQVMKMWGTDVITHTIHSRCGTTHCTTAGNKNNPPLLLLHGVGDNSAVMWALNIKVLSSRYYCIAVDTMGGPGKTVPNEHFTKASFNTMDWLNEIIDYFKLDKIYIAGVSHGAYMAYQFTTMYSDRVWGAVCMEGGIITNPMKSMIRTMLLMFPQILLPTKRNMLNILKKMSSPHSDVFEKYPLLAEHMILVMKSHNQKAMFPHQIEKYDKEKGMAVRDKLYFLIGDHVKVLDKTFVILLEDGQYHYKIVPKTGHGINMEQPDDIHDEMFRFLLGHETDVGMFVSDGIV